MPTEDYAERQRKRGLVNKNMWITADAARSLDRLLDREPGKHVWKIASEAIIAYDRKITRGDVLSRLNQALIDVRICTELLEKKAKTGK